MNEQFEYFMYFDLYLNTAYTQHIIHLLYLFCSLTFQILTCII